MELVRQVWAAITNAWVVVLMVAAGIALTHAALGWRAWITESQGRLGDRVNGLSAFVSFVVMLAAVFLVVTHYGWWIGVSLGWVAGFIVAFIAELIVRGYLTVCCWVGMAAAARCGAPRRGSILTDPRALQSQEQYLKRSANGDSSEPRV